MPAPYSLSGSGQLSAGAEYLGGYMGDPPGAGLFSQTGGALLPGAFYTLREKQTPPIELFREHGVAMAVATDCNPGTSPLTSPLLALNMAATLFGLTVDECLAGVTRNAARALGLGAAVGSLEVGKWADLAIWDIDSDNVCSAGSLLGK